MCRRRKSLRRIQPRIKKTKSNQANPSVISNRICQFFHASPRSKQSIRICPTEYIRAPVYNILGSFDSSHMNAGKMDFVTEISAV